MILCKRESSNNGFVNVLSLFFNFLRTRSHGSISATYVNEINRQLRISLLLLVSDLATSTTWTTFLQFL